MDQPLPTRNQGFTVVLKGAAGPTARAAFAGLQVSVESGQTIVTGIIPDQAALFGVLERAQDLGLSVLEVQPPAEGSAG